MTHSPPLDSLLWRRFTWRHWKNAPVSSGLLLGIVALGVGVFFAVRLANRSAVAEFQNFTDVLTTESDGLIVAPAGMLPESVLGELRRGLEDDAVRMIPVLESTATRPRTSESETIGSRSTYTLLGVDLIALQNLAGERTQDRRWFGQSGASPSGDASSGIASAADPDLWTLFRDPRSAFISEAQARREGLKVGDELPLVIHERVVSVRVAGIIPADPSRPRAPAHLMVFDLPALQRLTDATGRLSRVEFLMEEGPGRAERWAAVRATLERFSSEGRETPRWRVSSPAERRSSADKMTRAFRLNLTILSLLALLVGLYLIFQALDGAVVRRRDEIAILRSLGMPPSALRRAWLLESAMLGLLGGLLGLGLGWIGAQGAVRLVSRTVNALYFSSAADAASLSLFEALLALGASVLTCLLAGWIPAKAAASIPPAQVLARSQGIRPEGLSMPRRLAVVLGLGAVGGLGCLLPPLRLEGGGRFSLAAYAVALVWVLGAGLLGGAVLERLARALAGLGRHGVAWRLALSHLRTPSSRHRLAVAGLVCAVAMTAGMAILVGSFDLTMRGWIQRTFQADLYVSSDGAQSASTENRISPTTWQAVAAHPAVARAQIVQAARLQLPIGETLLVGADLAFFREFARPAWIAAPTDDTVFDATRNVSLALVSEAFSERFRVRRGDQIELPTPGGLHSVTIAGIFSDYGNERGSLLVDRGHFSRWFGDELASSLILVLRPGFDVETVRSELRAAHPGLAVFTQSYLRTEALRIFRQTFSITYALELIGVVVAVAGLGFTLMSLLWERRDELATLRTLGMRRGELAAAAVCEGVVTAVAGVGVGLVASLALGWLLIHRVNRQTFGWTLETHWPWAQMGLLAVLILGAAILTGWGVGFRGARIPAEREE
jgi:putative ABC transport system permease protein